MQKTKKKKRCRDGVTCVVLCTLPSIYLVCVVFGTAIPTSLYILENVFHTLYIDIGHMVMDVRGTGARLAGPAVAGPKFEPKIAHTCMLVRDTNLESSKCSTQCAGSCRVIVCFAQTFPLEPYQKR